MSNNSITAQVDTQLMVEAVKPPYVLHKLNSEDIEFVRACIRTLVQLFQLFGFDAEGYSTRGSENQWLYCCSFQGNPLKFVKTKLAAFFSVKKTEMNDPQEPVEYAAASAGIDCPGVLLGGRAYRWLRYVQRSNTVLFDQLLVSILQSKKGMARPSASTIRRAEIETFVKLTSLTTFGKPCNLVPNWSDLNGYHNNVQTELNETSLFVEVRRTVKEIFGGHRYGNSHRVKIFFPSTSANYINSRGRGGAVGFIKEHPELLAGLETTNELVRIWDVTQQSDGIRSRLTPSVYVDDSPLLASFETLYERMMEAVFSEKPEALPLGLPEALKVRVITKGPPLLNTVLRPVQKFMHSIMRQHPFFRLIGEPISALYIHDRLGAKLAPDQSFLSVDYADATNGMVGRLSEWIADAIGSEISLKMREIELFRRALTQHVLRLSGVTRKELISEDWNFTDEELFGVVSKILDDGVGELTREQVTGQLMGSIVSFIVLCVANGTILRWSHEIASKRPCKLADVPGCVNGDDGVLRTTVTGKRAWEQIATFCGLKPSVGKVYFSKQFLNMNSEEFHYHPTGYETIFVNREDRSVRRLICFEPIPYVNLGLLYGLKRSGERENSEAHETSPSFRARYLLDRAPSDMREKLLANFIHHNSKSWERYPLPWFLPESLGGLGLPCVGRFQPDRNTRCIARKILDHPKRFKLPPTPLTGVWRVWQYAQSRYRSASIIPSMVAAEDRASTQALISTNDLLGYLCVEALFRCPLDKLKQKSKSDAVDRTLKKRSLVFRAAMRDQKIPYPEPLNLETYIVPPSTDEINFIHLSSKMDSGVVGLAALHEIRLPAHRNPVDAQQHSLFYTSSAFSWPVVSDN